MRKLALLTLLVVVPVASAQRMGGRVHFSPRQGYSYSGYSYPWLDPLNDLPLTDTAYPAASQPMVIVVPQAAPMMAEPAPVPGEPLLIELRGDRYVRVSGHDARMADANGKDSSTGQSGRTIAAGWTNEAAVRSSENSVARQAPAVATVLVFRDGHREEVSEYTIAQGMLYTNGNYYASGSWLRRIDLSTLNVAETVAANHSRNVQFDLPNSPNEVIVAP